MTTKAELLALAERVEQASGADRELDALVEIAVRGFPERQYAARNPHWPDDRVQFVQQWTGCKYTGSLDQAMTLVPEGWQLRQMNFSGPCADDRKWHLNLHGGAEGQDCFVGRGATPAQALCAAALRAHAHAKEEDNG